MYLKNRRTSNRISAGIKGRAGVNPALTFLMAFVSETGVIKRPISVFRISYTFPSPEGNREIIFPACSASSKEGNTPLYAGILPLLCAVTFGTSLQAGDLSFAFFSESKNSFDDSISLFISAIVFFLGEGTVFVTFPYSTVHETRFPSSSSGKSSLFSMRSSSNVTDTSSMSSVTPAYAKTGGFENSPSRAVSTSFSSAAEISASSGLEGAFALLSSFLGVFSAAFFSAACFSSAFFSSCCRLSSSKSSSPNGSKLSSPTLPMSSISSSFHFFSSFISAPPFCAKKDCGTVCIAHSVRSLLR